MPRSWRCPKPGRMGAGQAELGPVGLRAPFQPCRSVIPRPMTRALWTKARSKPGVPLSHTVAKPDLRSRRTGAPRHGQPRLAAPPAPRAQKNGPGSRPPPPAARNRRPASPPLVPVAAPPFRRCGSSAARSPTAAAEEEKRGRR